MRFIMLFSFLFALAINTLYAQVKIKEIVKQNDTPQTKSSSYDSLKNFEEQQNRIDYQKYIGLDFYVPPDLPPTDKDRNIKHCLFSIEPSIIPTEVPKTDNIGERTQPYRALLTYVYKPIIYAKGISNGNVYAYVYSDEKKIGDKYYTILNVLSENELNELIGKMETKIHDALEQNVYGDYYEEFRAGERPNVAFLIKDNSTGEKLYLMLGYSRGMNFTFVSYFAKQKELYDGKTFIAIVYERNDENADKLIDATTNKSIKIKPLSKWSCEVALLKDKNYSLSYILKNDLNQTIIEDKINCFVPSHQDIKFLLESEYIKSENEKKQREKEQAEAIKKQQKEQSEKERNDTEHKRQYAISKFGEKFGGIIAQNKVELGMNMEMCKASWGEPNGREKASIKEGIEEQWNYGFFRNLVFLNGILVDFKE